MTIDVWRKYFCKLNLNSTKFIVFKVSDGVLDSASAGTAFGPDLDADRLCGEPGLWV